MFDVTTRARFADLRNREIDNDLTDVERVELAGLVRQIEEAELESLRPSFESRERAVRRIEDENEELRALIRREERVAARLTRLLTTVEAEQRAIASARERIAARSLVMSDANR